jgi:hypothetical protein
VGTCKRLGEGKGKRIETIVSGEKEHGDHAALGEEGTVGRR